MTDKICKNCDNLKMIYRGQSVLSYSYNTRYCIKQCKLMKYNDCCEYWCKKKYRYDLSNERFEEILKQILYLSKHIEEMELQEIEQQRIEREIRCKALEKVQKEVVGNCKTIKK